ncbi:MAG: enoyl-CoA hydratase/isomerase family protein [Fusobacteriaceae bacterium]|jgi:enoyl-CoA hydratase/carnithine racemase|nr:enoyl-CoA hydratase/isomerase family protein [Fusobacteriaceae bacterium]
MAGKVNLVVEGFIALITINNPPMNPLDIEVMDGIRNSFEHLYLEEDIRTVIITGNGKSFVAGADIKELKRWTPESSMILNGKGQALVNLIENYPSPVIAAINGYALGGGLEIALGCDIRLASEKAKLGLPEAKLGIIPGYGGTARLCRAVGIGQAKKMMYTGSHITADEAFAIGLVQEVLPSEKLLSRAMEIAHAIAENAPIAVRAIKRIVNICRNKSVEESLAAELYAARDCYASADSGIGIDAFINKEIPKFHGN